MVYIVNRSVVGNFDNEIWVTNCPETSINLVYQLIKDWLEENYPDRTDLLPNYKKMSKDLISDDGLFEFVDPRGYSFLYSIDRRDIIEYIPYIPDYSSGV